MLNFDTRIKNSDAAQLRVTNVKTPNGFMCRLHDPFEINLQPKRLQCTEQIYHVWQNADCPRSQLEGVKLRRRVFSQWNKTLHTQTRDRLLLARARLDPADPCTSLLQ